MRVRDALKGVPYERRRLKGVVMSRYRFPISMIR
jgi:hypothetical protein